MKVLETTRQVKIKVLPRMVDMLTLKALCSDITEYDVYKYTDDKVIAWEVTNHLNPMGIGEIEASVNALSVFKEDYRVQGYIRPPFIAPDMYLVDGMAEMGINTDGTSYFIHSLDSTVRYIVLEA